VRAIRFSEYGKPEVLELAQAEDPEPGPGQVRVSVRAVGVNPIEWKVRSGMMAQVRPLEFPAGLGVELAGVIDKLGDGVTELGLGEEVLGYASTPAYAELAVCDADHVVARPGGISWEEGAAVPVGARTAYRVLELLNPVPGETLLIHAAAGGVGIFATQFAIERGARVIGTASEANHEFLRSIGAVPVAYGDGLRERVLEIAPDGVDAVLDASGRGELQLSVELAGGPARVVTIAAAQDAAQLGVRFSGGPGAVVDTHAALSHAVDLLVADRLQVPIWRTYSLADAAAAHAESERGHLRGKIVLIPDPYSAGYHS
jgi:NADPH:quinone reductase-like Zn-dependent oxidoreductase